MGITHVIRGQEFLASTPKYLNLYDALDIPRPIFASVPPIMNEQGTKKLAKRDGAKDILAYREEGYLTDAILNFLASLGWNDGTEQEVFTRDELIEKFSLKRVQNQARDLTKNACCGLTALIYATLLSISFTSMCRHGKITRKKTGNRLVSGRNPPTPQT